MEQSYILQKPVLANQDGIWKIGAIYVDLRTVEILSTNLHDFCVLEKNCLMVALECYAKMEKKWGRGSELAFKECVCKI